MAKTELQFINILKAVAIIFVIITHNKFSLNFGENIFFMYFINMAVPIFMLISGFNYSLSFSRIKNNNILGNVMSILRKFIRITIPFLIIFLVEWFFNIKNIQVHHFTTALINGGVGPGSYYYPVMVQLIILFPLIYLVLKKYKEKGLALLFILQFLSDIVFYLSDINSNTYRILCFRYLFLVSLGCYLALRKEKINSNALLFIEIIGINFINILICSNSTYAYAPYNLWKETSLITSFYIFPIFAYIYYNYNINSSNIFVKILSETGRASWHIFLIQMLYFIIIPEELNIQLRIMLPLSLFVNIIIGWLFYKIEKQISSCVKNQINKLSP